jgi:hypothetical protein
VRLRGLPGADGEGRGPEPSGSVRLFPARTTRIHYTALPALGGFFMLRDARSGGLCIRWSPLCGVAYSPGWRGASFS